MRRVAILCLLAGITLSAGAQQQPKTIRLDLDRAVKIALDENPTIQVANLEIERYDYVKKENIGNLLPSLSATGTYSRGIIKQKMGGSISFEGDNTISGAANLTLPLFVPGVYTALKLTKEQMLGAVEAARGNRLALVNAVKGSFYNILLAEQSLEVLHTSERNITKTLESIRTMHEHGLASEYDLITAEVQLSNLRPSIIQTENGIKVGKMQLRMYLSIPQDVEVELDGSLDGFKEQVLAGTDHLSTDISANSDLKTLDIQQLQLDRQLKLQRTQRMPTLAGFMNYQVLGQDPDLNAMFASFNPGGSGMLPPSKYRFNWQHPLSAGFQLSIPIFSGLKNVNKERQIKNNISQLKLQRDYAEEGLNVSVRSSISNLLTAREKMFANEKTVGQAQKAYEIATASYRAGAGNIIDVNSSEINLTTARLNYTQAIYDYLTSQAAYEEIIGKE